MPQFFIQIPFQRLGRAFARLGVSMPFPRRSLALVPASERRHSQLAISSLNAGAQS